MGKLKSLEELKKRIDSAALDKIVNELEIFANGVDKLLFNRIVYPENIKEYFQGSYIFKNIISNYEERQKSHALTEWAIMYDLLNNPPNLKKLREELVDD